MSMPASLDIDLNDALLSLLEHNSLNDEPLDGALSATQISLYIRAARRRRPEIHLRMGNNISLPPSSLPPHVSALLINLTDMTSSPQLALACWEAFREIIWNGEDYPLSPEEVRLFVKHGAPLKLTPTMFYPPVRNCMTCETLLREPRRFAANYYSMAGGEAVYTTSLYCRS